MNQMEDFKKAVCVKVGSVTKTMFWKDRWCSQNPLCREIPQIFSITSDKNALVANYWNWMEDGGTWRVSMRRHFNDWEGEHMARLLDIVEEFKLNREKEDAWQWMLCKNGTFSGVLLCLGIWECTMIFGRDYGT